MRKSLEKLLKLFKYILLVTGFAWCIGFISFIISIPTPYNNDTDATLTDAIVVLTGGSMRLETGLNLLSDTKAKKILISGVGPNLTKKQVLKLFSNEKNRSTLKEKDIVLGDMADSTISNAIEAKIFMDLNGFKSMRLVTSNYHMPRSKMIFHYYLPDYEIIMHPVGDHKTILFEKGKYRLIFNEYNKIVGLLFIAAYHAYSNAYDSIELYVSKKLFAALN